MVDRLWKYEFENSKKKKKADIINALNETIIVKHLLCSVLFWSPHLEKAALKLENIQKRMAKRLKKLS